MIGTVSSEEKAALAREAGADEVIVFTRQDFETEVKRLTGGKGVEVVYDGVGKATFEKNLNVMRLRGMLVLYGMSSGPVPPVDPAKLAEKGSLYMARTTLAHFTATREELLARTSALFGMIAEGKLKLRIAKTYPLAEAAQAHRDMEARKMVGEAAADSVRASRQIDPKIRKVLTVATGVAGHQPVGFQQGVRRDYEVWQLDALANLRRNGGGGRHRRRKLAAASIQTSSSSSKSMAMAISARAFRTVCTVRLGTADSSTKTGAQTTRAPSERSFDN